jgi:dihydroorotase-like cyclic amidohydrolase
MFDLPVMDHCQDYSLVTDGVMHEGYWSAVLGLRGWPAAGEELIVARNILLAELTGHALHCQHLSAAGSVRCCARPKARRAHFRRSLPASFHPDRHGWPAARSSGAATAKIMAGRRRRVPLAVLRHEFQNESAVALAADRAAVIEGLGGWHAGDHQQRPRAALRLREGSRVRLRAVWHRRF